MQGNPLSERDFMQAIDQEIIQLHDSGDVNHVMSVLNGLNNMEGVTGHAKARLLWATNEWFKVNVPGEVFSDHVTSTTELKKVTVNNYITTWRYVEDCTIPMEIVGRPMRDLVPIAKTLSQGYEISKEQWRKIHLASNDGELRDILRQIKKKPQRKSARVIKLTRDGSLYGWKAGKKYFLGFLEIKAAATDAVLAEFIEKIKIGAGVIEE